jgi:RepB DNA-primase N-terminal domain
VFLDADSDGPAVLSRVKARRDLPPPSYVLHSSPNRVHLFWRVTDFDHNSVERLQKQLASELQTDRAATPVTQNTRLPGFFYLKSPVVRTSRTTLISQGPTYAAVTHSWKDEVRQRRPESSLLSWRQFVRELRDAAGESYGVNV